MGVGSPASVIQNGWPQFLRGSSLSALTPFSYTTDDLPATGRIPLLSPASAFFPSRRHWGFANTLVTIPWRITSIHCWKWYLLSENNIDFKDNWVVCWSEISFSDLKNRIRAFLLVQGSSVNTLFVMWIVSCKCRNHIDSAVLNISINWVSFVTKEIIPVQWLARMPHLQ